jgi:hypothetical protein
VKIVDPLCSFFLALVCKLHHSSHVMRHTPTKGRGDSAAQSLIGKAASTNWLVRFVNGGQMIEWGINKAAIVSLMQSRYGFTQWVEFVQGIDPLTSANNPNNA